MLICFSLGALAEDGVKVDILMAKIMKAIKAERAVDALPSFAELESMEPTLKKPLSENFHYYYIDALNNSGDFVKALSRSDIYLEKFGKKGKHYGEVIEVKINAEEQVEKANKLAAEKRAQEARQAQEEKARQEYAQKQKEYAQKQREQHCQNARDLREQAQNADDCSGLAFMVGLGGSTSESQRTLARCQAPRDRLWERSKEESALCNKY